MTTTPFRALLLPAVLAAVSAFAASGPRAAPQPQADPGPHRSPIDLCVLPGGRFVVTANHAADSLSVVDLEQKKVRAEKPCGRKPSVVACSADGRWVAVSNLWSGTVSLFAATGGDLEPAGEV